MVLKIFLKNFLKASSSVLKGLPTGIRHDLSYYSKMKKLYLQDHHKIIDICFE